METESRISYEDMKDLVRAMSEVTGRIVPGMSLPTGRNYFSAVLGTASTQKNPPSCEYARTEMKSRSEV